MFLLDKDVWLARIANHLRLAAEKAQSIEELLAVVGADNGKMENRILGQRIHSIGKEGLGSTILRSWGERMVGP